MTIDQLKDFTKGYYFLWVGQNATTGHPNKTTGNMSLYGEFIAFKDKDQRDDYYNNFRSNGYDKCVKCTATTGRQYKLGLTVYGYYELLAHAVLCNRP